MLFRTAILRALASANLSAADRGLLLHYALLPRVRGLIDGTPCTLDMMQEAEAEMTKAAVAQGLVPAAGTINWGNLANWLVQNLPAIISLITELIAAFGAKA